MSLLRRVADLLTGRPPIIDPEPTPLTSFQPLFPLSEPWREAMGRCGADCHVRDHRDALQQLGHTLDDLHRVEAEYNTLWDLHADMVRDRDRWRLRARSAEAKLRHPTGGDLAA